MEVPKVDSTNLSVRQYVENIKPYLTSKVEMFKAGAISNYLPVWEELTSDFEVLATVSGLPIEFDSTPSVSGHLPARNSFSSEEHTFIGKEINSLLRKGVIKESFHEPGEFISPIFLTPKSDGSFRLILNLKKLNEFMPYIHFKMDTINSVLKLVTKNCYMAKIDIKDAYYSVPIHEDDKKYLKFVYNNKLYVFVCLPNGLCSGPRKFTKLLKPPLASMRLQNCLVSGYIDDLITIHRTLHGCFQNIKLCITLLDSLGFVIHPDKSEFYPSQIIEYLGFVIDSTKMIVSLTDREKTEDCRLVYHNPK